jgi:4'-phosphopantetheinyl transferase EntD
VRWDRLVFSAKESVYKAWFPVARRWLGFGEATVEFTPGEGMSGTFSARILQSGAPITRMSGRWTIESGLVLTAVTL